MRPGISRNRGAKSSPVDTFAGGRGRLRRAYGAFWAAPPVSAIEVGVEVSPFYHMNLLARRESLLGFGVDLIWLFLPAGFLFLVRLKDRTNEVYRSYASPLRPLSWSTR